MSDWIKAINPTGPITNEADASAAARGSALSIVIGVLVGIASIVWTILNPQDVEAAVAMAGAESPEAASAAAMGAQATIWIGGALVVVQAIFAFLQWRDPKKWIAILFLVLLAYGIVSTLATPALSGMVPNMPVIPMWQIALSLAIMVLQVVMHVAGMRGIGRLDTMQMDAAR